MRAATKGLVAAAALAVAALIALPLLLGGTDPDAVPTVTEVSGRVMSPFCPGLTLEECPTDQSWQLRAQIAEMIQEGRTNAEIDRWMVDNYGEVALATPGNTWAWLAPVVMGLAGLALVIGFVARRTASGSEGQGGSAETLLDAEEAVLVEEDLMRYRKGSE